MSLHFYFQAAKESGQAHLHPSDYSFGDHKIECYTMTKALPPNSNKIIFTVVVFAVTCSKCEVWTFGHKDSFLTPAKPLSELETEAWDEFRKIVIPSCNEMREYMIAASVMES